MKQLGYSEGYKYSHDYYKDMPVEDPERLPTARLQEYLPERLAGRRYYEPTEQSNEASIKKWLGKCRKQ
jgi:putative ATPase